MKEDDGKDIFVHQDDIEMANIDVRNLSLTKNNKIAFSVLEYVGKYKKSKKAVNLIKLDWWINDSLAGFQFCGTAANRDCIWSP